MKIAVILRFKDCALHLDFKQSVYIQETNLIVKDTSPVLPQNHTGTTFHPQWVTSWRLGAGSCNFPTDSWTFLHSRSEWSKFQFCPQTASKLEIFSPNFISDAHFQQEENSETDW